MEFDDLEFEQLEFDGYTSRAIVNFDNGYGASIVTGGMTYTNDDGPYELAVLDKGKITYATPITDDVIVYLTESEVMDLLKKISLLSREEN